jgi:hypothetical protein
MDVHMPREGGGRVHITAQATEREGGWRNEYLLLHRRRGDVRMSHCTDRPVPTHEREGGGVDVPHRPVPVPTHEGSPCNMYWDYIIDNLYAASTSCSSNH